MLRVTVQLVAAAAVLGLAGVALGETGDVATERFSADSLLAYLVVPGSILAYMAFVWLLANAPITTVATYAYVNPVVAVFLRLGAALRARHPTIAAGAAAVLLSVAPHMRRQPGAA